MDRRGGQQPGDMATLRHLHRYSGGEKPMPYSNSGPWLQPGSSSPWPPRRDGHLREPSRFEAIVCIPCRAWPAAGRGLLRFMDGPEQWSPAMALGRKRSMERRPCCKWPSEARRRCSRRRTRGGSSDSAQRLRVGWAGQKWVRCVGKGVRHCVVLGEVPSFRRRPPLWVRFLDTVLAQVTVC